MNKRRILAMFAMLPVLGCDPFAPARPEPPSSTRSFPRAESSDRVAPLLDSALGIGDRSGALSLLDPSATLALEGSAQTNALDNCFQSLAAQASEANFTLLEKTPDVSDTFTRVLEYSIQSAGRPAVSGKATWILASPSVKNWRLRRWIDDPAYPSSLYRSCGGGSP